jgi:hypothetical protein
MDTKVFMGLGSVFFTAIAIRMSIANESDIVIVVGILCGIINFSVADIALAMNSGKEPVNMIVIGVINLFLATTPSV